MIVLRVAGMFLAIWMAVALGMYWVTNKSWWLDSFWLAVRAAVFVLVVTFLILLVERLGGVL